MISLMSHSLLKMLMGSWSFHNENYKYGFKVPSFIDCSKLYHIEIDETIDLSLLDTREVSDELANRVTERAKRLKLKNKHKIYNITIEELKKYNLKIIKK